MMDRRLQSMYLPRWTMALCAAAMLAGCADRPSTEVGQAESTSQTHIAKAESHPLLSRPADLRYPLAAMAGLPKVRPVALEFSAPPLPAPPSVPAAADAPYQPRPIRPELAGELAQADELIVVLPPVSESEDLTDELMRLPAPPDDEVAATLATDFATDAHSGSESRFAVEPSGENIVEGVNKVDSSEELEATTRADENVIESRWGPVDLAGEADATAPTVPIESRWDLAEQVKPSSNKHAGSRWDIPAEGAAEEATKSADEPQQSEKVALADEVRRLPAIVFEAATEAAVDHESLDQHEQQQPLVGEIEVSRLPEVSGDAEEPNAHHAAAGEIASVDAPVVVKPLSPELTLPEAMEADDRAEPKLAEDAVQPAAEPPAIATEPAARSTAVLQPPVVEVGQHALANDAREQAMRAVRMRAEVLVRHAFSLGQRGAKYSARAELIEALRMISQALDAQSASRTHSEALARAFRALEEADDFIPHGTALDANIDMAVLVRGHKTPVLKEADLSGITPLVALQRYYTFAQRELTKSAGEERSASVALFGLGQLESLMHKQAVGGITRGAPKAMVFHQAAMMTDPGNYKAANELGVLLARYGQYEQAREVLVHSVRVAPRPESWNNLAIVHQHLGQHDLARRAAYESQLAARNQPPSGEYAEAFVRWVEPEELAGDVAVMDDMQIPTPEQPGPRPNVAAPVSQSGGSRLMRLIPWVRGE